MRKIYYILTAAILLAAGCGSANKEYAAANMISTEADIPQQAEIVNNKIADDGTVVDVKLIKTGNIAFKTSNVNKTISFVKDALAQFSAYSTNENSYSNGEKNFNYNITVRVPAQNFEKLFDYVIKNADIINLDSRAISTEDVTEEFIDVSARVKVKKESEQRLAQLLSRAGSLKELFEIEQELASVRGQIESMEGRLKYLSNQVSTSTINISFYEQGYLGEASSWKKFADRLTNALASGWEIFLSLIVVLGYLWMPILIGLGVLIWYKKFRKKTK